MRNLGQCPSEDELQQILCDIDINGNYRTISNKLQLLSYVLFVYNEIAYLQSSTSFNSTTIFHRSHVNATTEYMSAATCLII